MLSSRGWSACPFNQPFIKLSSQIVSIIPSRLREPDVPWLYDRVEESRDFKDYPCDNKGYSKVYKSIVIPTIFSCDSNDYDKVYKSNCKILRKIESVTLVSIIGSWISFEKVITREFVVFYSNCICRGFYSMFIVW